MQKGKLKWFDNNKNFGFIETEDGKEVFAHRRSFKGFKAFNLLEGEEVVFDLIETEKGLQATNVAKVSRKAQLSVDIGRKYFGKHIKEKTEFIFNFFKDAPFSARIIKNKPYEFTVAKNKDEQEQVKKLSIKYIFKKPASEFVKSKTNINEKAKSQKRNPSEKIRDRLKIDSDKLVDAYLNKKMVEVTLLGGEMFRGAVNWFTKYEILFRISEKTSLILFKHAICEFYVTDQIMKFFKGPRPGGSKFGRRPSRDFNKRDLGGPSGPRRRVVRTYRSKD